MATTYDYSTGRIERDFHFVERDTACRLTQLPARVGSEWCRRCEHHRGDIYSWELRGEKSYVMCSHKDMKDAEDCQKAVMLFNERFEQEALEALCY